MPVLRSVTAFAAAVLSASAFATIIGIGPNETVTVNSNDELNADGYNLTNATATLVLNIESAPNVVLKGTGVIRKTSDATWTMAKANTAFAGTWKIEKGIVKSGTVDGAFGSKDKYAYDTYSKIYVSAGAQLDLTSTSCLLYNAEVHIAGDGPNNTGALRASCGGYTGDALLRKLYLEDDARVVVSPANVDIFMFQTTLRLQGHQLRYVGGRIGLKHWDDAGDFRIASGADLVIRQTTIAESKTGGFSMIGSGKLDLTGVESKNINRPLRLCGTGNRITAMDYWNSDYQLDTNCYSYAGSILFTNETGTADLTFSNSDGYYYKKQLSVLGPISGAGTVRIGDSTIADYGRICLANPNNTFTGNLVVNGSASTSMGHLQALYPTSIPDCSKVTCSSGYIDLPIVSKDGVFGWTDADVTNLQAKATWADGTFVVLDDEYAAATSDPRGFSSAILGWGKGAGARFETALTNAAALADRNCSWHLGTATLSDSVCTTVKTVSVYNRSSAYDFKGKVYTPTLVLDGGLTLVSTGAAPWCVGCGALDAAPSRTARLVVKNATIMNPKTPRAHTSTMNGYDYALAVGSANYGNMTGILDVREGAVVSNKLLVSGWSPSDSAGGGCGKGLVLQSGGKVFSLGANSTNYKGPGLGVGGSGYGCYYMTGGEFKAYDSFFIGGYGMGLWTQTGGTATFGTGLSTDSFGLGMGNGGWGSIDLTGGTMAFNGGIFDIAASWTGGSEKTRSTVAVDGSTAVLSAVKELRSGIRDSGTRGVVTVKNGGRIAVQGMYKSKGSLAVSFDNGTYEVTATDLRLFRDSSATASTKPDAIIVRQGGVTVDVTQSAATKVDLYDPIVPPYGGGVASVTFGSAVTCVQPPFVDIQGDGKGAVGRAVWDPSTFTLTGVEIVDPGVGYTTASAVLYSLRDTKLMTCACTVSADANAGVTGAFTKAGAGTLNLRCTNTWGGATVVAGGTLKAMCDWAVPTNTAVVLAGGTLDFNSKTGEVSSVTYRAGGGAIVNASKASVPATAAVEIAFEEIAAGKTVTVPAGTDFSTLTVRVTGDASVLDPKVCAKYLFLRPASGAATGQPTIESADLPARWRYVANARGVSLRALGGLGIFLK